MSTAPLPSQTPPTRSLTPKQVQLKINNINTVITWKEFVDLLTCCHEFETNFFPTHAQSGSIDIKLIQ